MNVTINVKSLASLDPISNYKLTMAYTDSGSVARTLIGVSDSSGDVVFTDVDPAGSNYHVYGNHLTDDLWSKVNFDGGFDGSDFYPSQLKVQDNHPANYTVILNVQNDTGLGGLVALSGAAVTITSGGVTHAGVTDGGGDVAMPSVPSGPCTISVSKSGKQFDCNGDVIPSSTPKIVPSKVTLIGA